MSEECQLFYRRLKCLFPSIGFKEGKFLRDMKMHLRDFGIMHPKIKYNDLVKTFGKPEEIYMDYLESQGVEKACDKFHKRKVLRSITYSIIIIGLLLWISFTLVWWKSYETFNSTLPVSKQTDIITEGEISP